jgi:tRNA-dihydrouridine synthase
MKTGERMKPFTVEEKVAIAKEHLQKSMEFKGERRGILELRRHLTSYFKGLPNFKELRLKLVTTDCPVELNNLLSLVAQQYDGYMQDESINPSPWS